MAQSEKITQQTDNRFVNLYHVQGKNRVGKPLNYYVASRAKTIEQMKLKTKVNRPDGVIIYSLYGEKRDKVILVKQYRVTIDDYIYEFPAGLVEENEDYHQAAIREMHEETGLDFQPIQAEECFEQPYFTTIGMTDESCASVYGYATGTISRQYMEESEEIEVVLADREEVARILREENVAIMCAYQLMHFLKNDNPFYFLK